MRQASCERGLLNFLSFPFSSLVGAHYGALLDYPHPSYNSYPSYYSYLSYPSYPLPRAPEDAPEGKREKESARWSAPMHYITFLTRNALTHDVMLSV